MANLCKNNFVLISIGALPGALIRWHIDEIFIVNLIGCFLLGFINSLRVSRRYKLMVGFGFCGCMTTFSGWSLYLYNLISQGSYKILLFHSILIILIGFFSIFLGRILAEKINA